jgi:uncharacterized protein YjbJ (UPF0337 family)
MFMGSTSDKLKGKMKQAEGKMTGDRTREARGAAEETKGNIAGSIERAKSRVSARIEEAKAKRVAKRGSRTR